MSKLRGERERDDKDIVANFRCCRSREDFRVDRVALEMSWVDKSGK